MLQKAHPGTVASRRCSCSPLAIRTRTVLAPPRAAAGFLPKWLDFLTPRPAAPSQGALAQKKRDELLDVLLPPDAEAEVSREVADSLIDELVDMQVPFRLEDLNGGPGVVVYTRGPPQIWDSVQRLVTGGTARRKNRASQDLSADDLSVVNAAEVWGKSLYVTASGKFQPQTEASGSGKPIATPLPVVVFISGGSLHLGANTTLPLPIKGRGEFEVLYCDPVLRIFKSSNSYSVQVKDSYLDELEA